MTVGSITGARTACELMIWRPRSVNSMVQEPSLASAGMILPASMVHVRARCRFYKRINQVEACKRCPATGDVIHRYQMYADDAARPDSSPLLNLLLLFLIIHHASRYNLHPLPPCACFSRSVHHRLLVLHLMTYFSPREHSASFLARSISSFLAFCLEFQLT